MTNPPYGQIIVGAAAGPSDSMTVAIPSYPVPPVAFGHSPSYGKSLPTSSTPIEYLVGYRAVATASTALQPSGEQTFIAMAPLERIAFLAKNRPGELLLLGVSAFGALYTTIVAIYHLSPLEMIGVGPARAEAASQLTPHQSLDGLTNFHWYVALLMGLTLFFSLGLIAMAKSDKKVEIGGEMTRLIVGFIIGFLSGTFGSSR